MTLNAGESTSRRSVCEYTVHLAHNVVDPRSVDGEMLIDLMTSQSTRGESFPDFEMLDASALRKIISRTFHKKSQC